MLTVADIMTHPVVSLHPHHSLADAHAITRDKGIRHLPVLSQETGELVGIVTQKSMIAKVISLLNLYGEKALPRHERLTNVMEVALTDFETVPSTGALHTVAPFFLKNKHGCLPVVDANNNVVGMVTSSDFVKLSIRLLEQDSSH